MIEQNKALYFAWKRGLLEYKLHKGQLIIDEALKASQKKLFVLNISRQYGKTYWLVLTALRHAIKNPKSVIKIGTAFLTDLEEFIIPAFDKILEDCPEEILSTIKYDKTRSKFTFANGSQIKLVGLDRKPNGLRGNTIDMILLDECAFITNLEYLYKSVIVPTTIHRPNARIIIVSTPPRSPDHFFVELCKRAEFEGGYAHFTVYDNPMLTKEIIDSLIAESGGTDTTDWKREYLAEFVTDSNYQIIPEWKDEYIQTYEPTEWDAYYHRYASMDLGVRDFTATLFGVYDYKKATLYVQDELTMSGHEMTTILLKDAIRAKEAEIFKDRKAYRRVADNNNLMLLQDLGTLHGLHFHPTNKDTIEAMVNEVRMLVNAGRVRIDPRCKMLLGCLKYGIWNEKRNEFARSTIYKHFDHLAALVYMIRNLDQYTNPIPADYKISTATHYVPQTIRETANEAALKQLFGPKVKF